MSFSGGSDLVLQSYVKKFGMIPTDPNQLVSFSRAQSAELPPISYSDAKKVITKISTSLKTSGKTRKSSAKWNVGDEVLITKDRTAIIRYIGKVPEMGNDDIWYGIELTCGTLGQTDGMLKGHRYFQTEGKRAMFIPEKKLRRKLSKKDKERRNSYAEISSHVKQLQKEYAGTDAAYMYPSSRTGNNTVSPPMAAEPYEDHQQQKGLTTLVFENPAHAHKYGNGGSHYQIKSLNEPTDLYAGSPSTPNKPQKERRKSLNKNQRQRSGSGTSVASSSHKRKQYEQEEDEEDDDNESDVSELEESANNNDTTPTVKTFDTLLRYILRQKGQYREGLLDCYANPQTHPLIVEAFSQMKQLQPSEQAFLWPALLRRWSKYSHKI